jgi:NTP pyrophosphatase (non-canonical NTP hydrolase)
MLAAVIVTAVVLNIITTSAVRFLCIRVGGINNRTILQPAGKVDSDAIAFCCLCHKKSFFVNGFSVSGRKVLAQSSQQEKASLRLSLQGGFFFFATGPILFGNSFLGDAMTDQQMTLHELKERMATFVRERDWEQFHNPKNLSMALTVEASELMEHFQWLSEEQSKQLEPQALQQISEELADIVLYSLSLANFLQIDLAQTVLAKLEKNERKYPKQQVRGKAHKYTYYQQDGDA